ncbi:hypothetical protein [Pantoea sp. B65]|uniref:hypothetical protein n=1 Tax=Pantoea sp. B65 TaxID=2813359 RepID=UPI0039B63EB3
MTEQEITQARYHAACDIAHRWFAVFEGKTEEAGLHSALFSEDVMLVHAGAHLLAKGKAEMTRWLHDLPYERSAHFIRRIDVIPLPDEQAEVNMDISYQVPGQEALVGGALSEYRTTVKFDREHHAVFTFLQKTLRMPNPDKVFREAFAENRLRVLSLFLDEAPGRYMTIRHASLSETLR